MDTIPAGYYETNKEIISNFDHIINEDVVNEIVTEQAYAHYPGWHFTAYVWYKAC